MAREQHAVVALGWLVLMVAWAEGFVATGSRALRSCGKRTAAAALRPAAARRARSVAMRLAVGSGSYVALVTPMQQDGSIDDTALRNLLQWHLLSGTDGVVVLGTTGEASTLTQEEKARVLQITREEIGGKIPIMVGTSSVRPETVIANTEAAAAAGADACLVVTPYYVKPTQAGLVKFFTTVADAVSLPMIMYNVPGRTGVDMLTEAVAECSQHPTIVGMKEATGDNSRVAPLLQQCASDFLLYSGDDGAACDFVLQGGHGVISVTANAAPKLMAQLMAAAREGRQAEAEALNAQLDLMNQRLFLASNPMPVKWALHRMGRIPSGGIRLPLLELEQQHHAPLEAALQAAHCI